MFYFNCFFINFFCFNFEFIHNVCIFNVAHWHNCASKTLCKNPAKKKVCMRLLVLFVLNCFVNISYYCAHQTPNCLENVYFEVCSVILNVELHPLIWQNHTKKMFALSVDDYRYVLIVIKRVFYFNCTVDSWSWQLIVEIDSW